MSNVLSYRGYYATVEFDSEEGAALRSVVGMSDGVYFEVETAAGVESAFHELSMITSLFARKKGSNRRNPTGDRSNVRINPDLHRAPLWPRPCGRNR